MVVCGKGLSAAINSNIVGAGNEIVVLAHGYGGDQSIWDKIVPCLAEKYRVLLFDWNFSGASQANRQKLFDLIKYSSFDAFADDLIDLMDEMDLTSSVFVGHSMSGMIGCIASIKRPLLFRKLVLIGASPRYMNSEDYEGGFEMSEIEQILSSIETDFQSWASAFAPAAVGGKDVQAIEKFEKSLSIMSPEAALSVAKTIFLGDLRATLEDVSAPCTIIQTANDVVVPKSVGYFMQEKMKGKSKVEIIDTDGHFPQLTAHEQLLDVLGKALASP
ncbi:hypothetical protein Nepgr_029181 [Nepenthes gracilis]|uniref:AB hydrolase-1 domain-containing protein n=1 Tax=Nepenthes gracilis TaxID=150966 RepID=A0AAD3TDR3_NEPGR|nr:hypothetical protein Nepgr_029181 [Nepenthes gracilis]